MGNLESHRRLNLTRFRSLQPANPITRALKRAMYPELQLMVIEASSRTVSYINGKFAFDKGSVTLFAP